MDAQLIEQLDRKRYKSLLWLTIGLSALFVSMIAPEISQHPTARTLGPLLGIPGAVIFFIALLKDKAVKKEIKRNREIEEALNNELIRLYRYKSSRNALIAVTISAVVLCCTARWMPGLSVKTACLTILYVGSLSMYVSQLVYLKK